MFILKVKVLPRILLTGLLDKYMQLQTRSLSELSKLLKLNEKVQFTAEEQALLNVRIEKNAETGNSQYRWNHTKDSDPSAEVVDIERDIEFSDEQKEMLYTVFKELDDRKSFSGDNVMAIVELAEKIGYEIK